MSQQRLKSSVFLPISGNIGKHHQDAHFVLISLQPSRFPIRFRIWRSGFYCAHKRKSWSIDTVGRFKRLRQLVKFSRIPGVTSWGRLLRKITAVPSVVNDNGQKRPRRIWEGCYDWSLDKTYSIFLVQFHHIQSISDFQALPSSLDNGATSSACSPVLARSPDTTTATPTAADVSEDDDERSHKQTLNSTNRPTYNDNNKNNSFDGDMPSQVNEVGLVKVPRGTSPQHLTKKCQTKLQVK